MKKDWTVTDIPNLSGKVIIVTGGNSGLGFQSVKVFAEKGAQVILTSRSADNGEKAKSEILNQNPKAKIDIYELDLADLKSVNQFADKFLRNYSRLDVLLNNAGIMTTPYFKTADGFEGQVGTNHLGHFALTGRLLPALKSTSGSRVVNVSSIAHIVGKMDFDNFLFADGKGYRPMKAYSRSKLANLLFTYELQCFFESNGYDTVSLAAHPGVSQTSLFRYMEKKWYFRLVRPLFFKLIHNSENGAFPSIRASTDPDAAVGEFYGPSGIFQIKGKPVKVKSNSVSHNTEQAKKLWEISEKLTGVNFQ